MKTIVALTFLAALAAFALSLINVEVAATLMCASGLLGIMDADYGRRSLVPAPPAPDTSLVELPASSCSLSRMTLEPAA